MPAICGARSCKAKTCIEAGESKARTGAREGAVGLPPYPTVTASARPGRGAGWTIATCRDAGSRNRYRFNVRPAPRVDQFRTAVTDQVPSSKLSVFSISLLSFLRNILAWTRPSVRLYQQPCSV